ncbi:hypothetical protein HK104_007263 [Borealophlyctis nickersoniae]|nr:hypothetical protein HK104_007263 [Borealophlyctis nickersoniae]
MNTLKSALTIFSSDPHDHAHTNKRPAPKDRKFKCQEVEDEIQRVKLALKQRGGVGVWAEEVGEVFENCYPNTLVVRDADTTVMKHGVDENGELDTFIITGDIPAMWLRDSTNQVAPYIHLIPTSHSIRCLILGLINRQAKCVIGDPYANAFKEHEKWGGGEKDDTVPKMSKRVWEGKWEVDSLCAFLKLSNNYHEKSNDTSFVTSTWLTAVGTVLSTFRTQQKGSMEELSDPAYLFRRKSDVPTDTMMLNGQGPPAKRCGLIKCGFRPSDDACTLPFLVGATVQGCLLLRLISNRLIIL